MHVLTSLCSLVVERVQLWQLVQFSLSVMSDSLWPHRLQPAACQASLSITNSWSLLKLRSIESVMPSNRLIFCRPLLFLLSIFPSIRVFSNESTLCIGGQSTGVSASASVFTVDIQDWFPLGLTGWISGTRYLGEVRGLFWTGPVRFIKGWECLLWDAEHSTLLQARK